MGGFLTLSLVSGSGNAGGAAGGAGVSAGSTASNPLPKKRNKGNPCGSSKGIPTGESLIPATPDSGIFTSGEHSVVVTGYGSQVRVALTNISPVPAFAVTDVSFQEGTLNLGESGADILLNTTSTFTSGMFGVLGGPMSMTVNIDIQNDGAVEAAQFCVIGASGGG